MRINVASRLQTATPYLLDLITSVQRGEIKVPQFQRPFVWRTEQAINLLDSIANNYPMGSLLLWKTNDKLAVERNIGDFRLPETDDLSPTDYVLDGQQRLTVIYAALGAEPDASGFEATYDLIKQEFVMPGETERGLHQFPMRWLYKTTELLNFRTALQAHPRAKELQVGLDNLVHVFTSYQLPVVTLKDLSVEEVCPIFERINSSATQLSIFDLMVAATWSQHFDLNQKSEDIALALDSKSYGDISGTTVLKCLSAVRNSSVIKDRVMGLRKIESEKMDELAETTKLALLRAVDLLTTDFGVYSLDFLPYEAHLIILTYICAHNRSLEAEQVDRVKQWFWRTSFSERYRGASEAFISRDLEGIQEFVVRGGDPEAYGAVPNQRVIKSIVFRKNNSRSRAFVLALAKQGPRNLTNGAQIDTADALSIFNKKQFHHIYPEAYLKNHFPGEERSLLPNICMLAASENNLISDADPHIYLPTRATRLGSQADSIFRSNVLPLPREFDYVTASLAEFIDARASLIEAIVTELCTGKSLDYIAWDLQENGIRSALRARNRCYAPLRAVLLAANRPSRENFNIG
jgi:hypothetical protein